MKSGGTLVMTLRDGPAPDGMEMHPTSASEVVGLARTYGLEVLRVGLAGVGRARCGRGSTP